MPPESKSDFQELSIFTEIAIRRRSLTVERDSGPKAGFLLVLLAFALIGCGPRPSSLDKPLEAPFDGVKLRYAISSRFPHPELLEQRLSTYATRTRVRFEAVPEDQNADLYFFMAAEMPRLVEAKKIQKVADSFRAQSAPYDWGDLTQPYSVRLCQWNSVPMGVPLLGEGQVLVYRAERLNDPAWGKVFREKFGHDPRAPETWDELTDWAEFFTKPGAPSLPPLPKNDEDLERLFYTIAVNYDRRTLSQSEVGQNAPTLAETELLFAFHYDLKKYQPRLTKPAFQHALKLLLRMQKCRPKEAGDPCDALVKGSAIFAMLKLDELARLQSDRFSVAPLPGATFTYDYATDALISNKGGAVNRMPYLGWGSSFAGVAPDCRNSEAAYDFLADFGHPTKASLELIAAAKWGAGPYRRSHEETRNQNRWLGYGFDKANTDQLLLALRYENPSSIPNYRICLRMPNEREHTAILTEELRRVLEGKIPPETALKSASDRWLELGKKQPEAIREEWIRHSLGL